LDENCGSSAPQGKAHSGVERENHDFFPAGVPDGEGVAVDFVPQAELRVTVDKLQFVLPLYGGSK